MDGAKAAWVQPQASVCSDSTGDDHAGNDVTATITSPIQRICLIGQLAEDARLRNIAESFDVTVVSSPGLPEEISGNTIYVLETFEGEIFDKLHKTRLPLLGPPALQQLADRDGKLPNNTRPLFNLSMSGVVVSFTGFKDKKDLGSLVLQVHHMGGSIRKTVYKNTTHLIANNCTADKYRYATGLFKVPVMNPQWVHASWEKRHEIGFSATSDEFVAEHKLKPFHGAKVAFVGFAEKEEEEMKEVLLNNGGVFTTPDDPNCTHVVMDSAKVYTFGAPSAPLSPTPTSISVSPPPTNPTNFDNNTTISTTNYDDHFLETLHEKSGSAPGRGDIDIVCHNLNLNTLDSPGANNGSGRKRKSSSFSERHNTAKIKRRKEKEKCLSEKRCNKVSAIFKTPMNLFSNRRRTIDTSTTSFGDSSSTLNRTVMSSSGAFNVDTVQDLSSYEDENIFTPKKKRKGSFLFNKTFSSSKFDWGSSSFTKGVKKIDLNSTGLSALSAYGDGDCGYGGIDEKLNASCFPNISYANPVPNESRSGKHLMEQNIASAVVDDVSTASERPEVAAKPHIVKALWFWTSVQKAACLDAKEFSYGDYAEQMRSPSGGRRESYQASTPGSANARKRKHGLHEALSSLSKQQSRGAHKRRSSVSDATLLSESGSFLDYTASPDKVLVDGVTEPVIDIPRKALTARQQVILELVQTESNYVDILGTIMTMFKKHLEDMPEEEALLNNTELNLIFGKVPPIYDTHVKMLKDLEQKSTLWSENHSIGNIILNYSKELLKAYPPFINYFEKMKEVLTQCDQDKPRFHAFLKACQTKPECGRQSLQELMIRPVQRLGSICLLLASILKNTPKSNPDHHALEKALAALKNIMDLINEDKRKAEGQVTIFSIFNDIDNCPPDIVSSHRNFIAKAEVIQKSTEGLSSRGNSLMLFLFSDQIEVCKKKSKAFNNLKSPSASTSGSLQRSLVKPYKHVKLLPLNTIKRVINIKETDQFPNVFCLVHRSNDDNKEMIHTFAMADEEADKMAFLKILTRQMAHNACTRDADEFLACLEAHQLDIDTSDVNHGTLSKAFKFASRTRLKVGRAFSFNKTPSKLKRAVSSMMSPFGSSTNITPASELAQMRLASYNNINELGSSENASESPPMAPMSVQPTRKLKTASLNLNSLKRL